MKKFKSDYLPFILIFLACMLIISLMSIFSENKGLKDEKIQVNASNLPIDWYVPRSEENTRPDYPKDLLDFEEKYQVYIMGREEKEIYLTFNNGYEHNNYTLDVLDTLKDEGVPAAFFLTGEYLKKNPEIVSRMLEEGHIVGNHGNRHASIPKLTEEGIEKEILDFEGNFKAVMGQDLIKKYYRPASGSFTERSLQIARDLGYDIVFWSLAYADWDVKAQPGRDYAYNKVMKSVHPGAIIMLHTVSQSNTEALPDIIAALKAQGYVFKSLDDFQR